MYFSKLKLCFYAVITVTLGITGTSIAYAGGADTFHNINESLPVRSEGYRYTSNPYGEMLGILKVAKYTRALGEKQRVSTRGMKLSKRNQIVDRYNYTFPATCSSAQFSFYEGDGFSALGYHHDGQVILDVLEGGSPYTAPRLWGPFDQVLNDKTPMHTVVSFNGDNGAGFMSASFMAGKVTGMSESRQENLGSAYSSVIYTTSRCNDVSIPGTLLVTK